MLKNLKEQYSPLFFLSALGNGGLTVAFFIFFMFMTTHPDTPIATFDSVRAALTSAPVYILVLAAFGYGFMLYFAFNHIRLLLWNIREYRLFKQTEGYKNSLEEIMRFAGLESIMWGYGGDRKIADLLGINKNTVAKGRKQLLGQNANTDTIRRPGGGRKAVKKNP